MSLNRLRASEQQDFTEVVAFIAKDLDAGHSKQNVAEQMMYSGVDLAYAAQLVDDVDSARRSQHRRGGAMTIVIGLALMTFGVIVTAASYSLAVEGRTYVVTLGVAILGIWQVMRGTKRLMKHRET